MRLPKGESGEHFPEDILADGAVAVRAAVSSFSDLVRRDAVRVCHKGRGGYADGGAVHPQGRAKSAHFSWAAHKLVCKRGEYGIQRKLVLISAHRDVGVRG